jgi:signal transduction histidine kinase
MGRETMQMPKEIAPDKGLSAAAQEKSVVSRLKDYAIVGQKLSTQRIVIYAAALSLAAFYYDPWISAYFLIVIAIFEVYDALVLRNILKGIKTGTINIPRTFAHLYAVTFGSAATIALFCISIAIQQGTDGNHFLPLFLMVSASIFAAMNTHQFIPILTLRLAIYVAATLYIPLRDVWIVRPPMTSEIWLNLFTIVFVLGFIFELARTFLTGYTALLKSRLALQVEHKNALAASEAKTRFLHTVSHELRTPLTSIKGALDLINSGAVGEPPEKMARLLEMVGRNSNRLADLVGDLLLVQSSQAGQLSLVPSRFDMGELVECAVASFQAYAYKLGVKVETDIPEGTLFVLGDKRRLDQVITNLLSNAAKFSDAGGTVRVTLYSYGAGLALSVQDTGIGIPEGSEAKVFEEFGQIDSSDQRSFQGTGLGLSISKRIVEAHGGSIEYESILGVGSTFTMLLLADQ